VSLTAPLEEEIRTGWAILEALEQRKGGPKLISCPTCGRTEIDMMNLTEQVEKALQKTKKPITVAVMGCVVNGPGEAKEADVGVAGGRGKGVIFAKGEVIKTLKEKDLLPALLEEIEKINK
jgi:(E)-4-hydroxy-3-methylbut-2-enyl-diphosphate synthase